MEMNQTTMLEQLKSLSDQLENVCRNSDVVSVFADQVKPCVNHEGNILNIEIGISFQSNKSEDKPVYCLSNERIGTLFLSKHSTSGEWGEMY